MTFSTNITQIKLLNGDINDVNQTFTTPSTYELGTLVVIWNGQVVDKDDDTKGWTEVNSTTILLNSAPKTGDVLQAFYQETAEIDGVIGSPFHPDDTYP